VSAGPGLTAPLEPPAIPGSGPLAGATPQRRAANLLAQRLLGPLAILLALVLLVFYVLFAHSRVAGPSMLPTLRDGDYILVTKGLSQPRRGDVVVLDTTEAGRPTEVVKRIVAVAGDRVHIAGDFALVNGAPEQFPHMVFGSSLPWPVQDLTVPRGTVFVLGDNRPVSYDSRYLGPLSVAQIQGRVVAVYAPVGRIGLVAGP
jgi:signal peptidase I